MLHRGCRRPRLSHPRRSPHNARMPNWIDTPDALRARTGQLPAAIGLDTEFIRERTYWPQLALVQVALGPGDDDILLVDPLAPGMHEALAGLLQDTAVLKIMHSPSEDLVAFRHACGALPAPCSTPSWPRPCAATAPGWATRSWCRPSPGSSWPRARPVPTG